MEIRAMDVTVSIQDGRVLLGACGNPQVQIETVDGKVCVSFWNDVYKKTAEFHFSKEPVLILSNRDRVYVKFDAMGKEYVIFSFRGDLVKGVY